MSNVQGLLRVAKESGQDFEWYPTTNEILDAICSHIDNGDYGCRHNQKVLDIGAGNGKALVYFRDKEIASEDGLYAIEISEPLRAVMDESIFVIGTNLFEQSLWDKAADITFCNPPYSAYGEWVAKVLRESVSERIYFVIPHRWKDDKKIQDALRDRGPKVKAKVIGSFNFANAERRARAEVDIVYVYNPIREDNDPFDSFFHEYFGAVADKFDDTQIPTPDPEETKREEEAAQQKVVGGKNIIERLVTGYEDERQRIILAYEKIGDVDREILDELGINKDRLISTLRERVVNLKKKYWGLLFDNFDALTRRLTSKTRNAMMARLNSEMSVDFTVGNAYTVVIWAIKQVNKYVDDQLMEVFESLVGADSACAYKSNKKLFIDNYWRYSGEESRATHFYLDYRIVTERCGGLAVGDFVYGRERETGLSDRAYDMISDVLTVANNLGFAHKGSGPHRSWSRGAEFFHTHDDKELLKVRAFKNQNLHLFLNQDFMLALNVEYGRLRGWLSSPQDAAKELDEPKAIALYDTNLKLGRSTVPLLMD